MGHTLTSSVSWALLPIPHLFKLLTTAYATRFRLQVSRLSATRLALGGGLSSLSDCIIAQVFLFVKPFLLFFYFFGGKPVCPFLIPHRPFLLIYNAESVLQRILATYYLAGVVSQSAAKRGGLMQALSPRRLIKGFQLSRIPLFVI